MDAASMAVGLTSSVAGFMCLRLWPIWPRRFAGCDAFNILLNAELLRAQRRLPIRVPGLFMLEHDEQWYPPGFLLLCALIPPDWLRQRYWLLNHLVDLCSALLLFAVALYFGVAPAACAVTVLVYAISAASIGEFATLNTRPLGLLLLNALLLCAYAASLDARWWVPALALGVMLVFSHKLSMQQLWLTLPLLSLFTADWSWLGLLAGSYALAGLLWPRGAWRVARGHWEIVRFWERNWPLLGAHAVRQSPVYGDGHTRTDVYADESPGAYLRFFKDAFHQNYFVLPVLTGWLLNDPGEAFASPGLHGFLLGWMLSVYLLGVSVHCVPVLRGIGLGRQYFKFAVLPALLYTLLQLEAQAPWPVWLAAGVALLLAARQYLLVGTAARRLPGAGAPVDEHLEQVMRHLTEDGKARTLALPVHLCDLLAYRVRRPVYWGTHSDVFDARLQAFFPVLRHELGHYVSDGANRLLLDSRYATPAELHLDPATALMQRGPYVLFDLQALTGDCAGDVDAAVDSRAARG